MAEIQKYFEQFHGIIKLNRFDENAELREKRDIVTDKLRAGLKKQFEDKDESCPKFDWFNQGSYEYDTGIQPSLKGDFDIDVGIRFHLDKNKNKPVEVKEWVYEALRNHTNKVEVCRPCVTVFYQKNNESLYHVDLAIYCQIESSCPNYLALGKSGSKPENKVWEDADPDGLKNYIKDRFSEDDKLQFKRVVRYIKRWRDVNFPSDGQAAPISIGLTLAACNWGIPKKNWEGKYNDCEALLNLTESMISSFSYRYSEADQSSANRLEIKLPVKPYQDVFKRMSNKQMETFKDKLLLLKNALQEAKTIADPHDACKILKKYFGDDFPVPSKTQAAQKTNSPGILNSGDSA